MFGASYTGYSWICSVLFLKHVTLQGHEDFSFFFSTLAWMALGHVVIEACLWASSLVHHAGFISYQVVGSQLRLLV